MVAERKVLAGSSVEWRVAARRAGPVHPEMMQKLKR